MNLSTINNTLKSMERQPTPHYYLYPTTESLSAVPRMAAALPRWTDTTHAAVHGYWWDSGSEVPTAICQPIAMSLKKWPASGPITPNVSTATWTTKWLESRWEYFTLFLCSIYAATAQLPLLQELNRKGPGWIYGYGFLFCFSFLSLCYV